ncbi:hypothetical protein CLV49_0268 [Labedella gwakjiensis]|uniref:Uncharacterized protein n=1 Tax=Labedella gwakjiensis TaxID=390269 RepID=A0A2P8GRS9_9MICO|nr:hypothetical protein [Labedella gwakjiensis]PSL36671.1 hypothetical protein CLV49_0268 [Labedella gwakjiensis]RUQ84192.1 hypothetical protein ELQ93_15325 [Labedella gwakjiensis]
MAPRHLRRIAAAALALAIVPALCSCSSLQLAFGSTVGGAYGAIDGFRDDDTLPAPSWVPDDASAIRYTTDLADHASILTFQSPTHFVAGTCELMSAGASASTAETGVPIDDSWWPETIPSSLFSCDGGWTAFTDGDTIYAFSPGTVADGSPST